MEPIAGDSVREILPRLQILRGLSDEERARLEPCFHIARLPRGQYVYRQGEPAAAVFVVLQGYVEMARELGEGRRYRILSLEPGDIFGIGEVFYDSHYLSVLALSDLRLLRISRADFHNVYLKIPVLNRRILGDFARIVRVWTNIFNWNYGVNKVILYLYFLTEDHGYTLLDRIIVQKKITHEHIADMLNLTREYVTRILRRFKKDGVVNLRRDKLVIDRAWLEAQIPDREFTSTLRKRFLDCLEN